MSADQISLQLRGNTNLMKTERLLVVEDDPDNLALLLEILREKYDVMGCGSAADALLALDTFKPDLFVLDVGMRPVDGLQFLDGIRGVPGYHNIPAIAMTGYASENDKLRFLASGFQAVVTKPILDRRDLESVVETSLKLAGLT
jgi:two-component system cell cycle response regulator DivK